MAEANESAVSLRWLLDDLAAPLTTAWVDVRDRMRQRTGQSIFFTTDWISDPWIANGVESANWAPTVAPIYDPPDQLDQWPDFGVGRALARVSLTTRRTRAETLNPPISPGPTRHD